MTDFGKGFFLFIILTVIVCGVTATAAYFSSRGKPGIFSRILTSLIAVGGSFLSCHWNDIGRFTTEQWKLELAIPTIVVEAVMITILSWGIAASIYNAKRSAQLKQQREGDIRRKDALTETVLHNPNEEECLRALQEISDEHSLPDIVIRAEKRSVSFAALGMISDSKLLSKLYQDCVAAKPEDLSLHFEIAVRSSDPTMCAESIERLLKKDADEAMNALTSIQDKSLLESVCQRILSDPGQEKQISESAKGRIIVEPPFGESMKQYCCPDGRLHDFEVHVEVEDLGSKDDDDMKAHEYSEHVTRTCRICGYRRFF